MASLGGTCPWRGEAAEAIAVVVTVAVAAGQRKVSRITNVRRNEMKGIKMVLKRGRKIFA